MKQTVIHTISDSTGETVQGLAHAVEVQFKNVIHKNWTLIKTVDQIEKIAESFTKNSIVIYTILNQDLINVLGHACKMKKIICISPMDSLFRAVKSAGGEYSDTIVSGKQHELNDQYFERVEAINFAVHQDDGQNPENLLQSDVIILGVSRTSKSPTSIYLANRGIRASNVPFVNNIALPEILHTMPVDGPLIVGLTRDAQSLVDIRMSRLRSLSADETSDYTNIDKVDEEILALKRLCVAHRWPLINVKKKSIEETATQIIKYMERHNVGKK